MEVPELLRNFRVYDEGNDLIGISDVEMPSLEAMTETVKGAGIAGEINSPVVGHFSGMELKLNWRNVIKRNIALAAPKSYQLDIRGDQQVYDSSTGVYKTCAVRVVVRGVPKTTELGKLDVGTGTDTSNTFEVNYLKVDIDGTNVIEIDKYNYICKINGTDYLSESREALGLA